MTDTQHKIAAIKFAEFWKIKDMRKAKVSRFGSHYSVTSLTWPNPRNISSSRIRSNWIPQPALLTDSFPRPMS